MKIFQESQGTIADLSSIEAKSDSFEAIALSHETIDAFASGSGLGNTERLIVVDSRVEISKQQIETFIDNGLAVLTLDAERDGIEQITNAIVKEDFKTVDIFSHGDRGSFTLGETELNSDTLKQYQNELTGWTGVSQSLDVLLYGCEVGAGVAGRSFIEEFGSLTGADIAASNDLTGSVFKGGDWELESQVGKIEANPIAIASFDSILSSNRSLLKNPGFDSPLGHEGWLVEKIGKVEEYERNGGKVAAVEDIEGGGKQMYLKLPQQAQDNYGDQLSLFQDVSGLKPDKVYSVEAKVKWTNPENKLPSAIVSFWAKNPNGTFRGQDFIISDGDGYKNLRFEFTPNEAGTTRFFLGLFTHIDGNRDDTEILVDNYKVTEIGKIAKGNDSRQGNILVDGDFGNYKAENWSPDREGWTKTVSSSIPGLQQSMMGENRLKLELPKAPNYKDRYNNEFTGVYQNVKLVAGQSYELRADFQRLKLDKFAQKEDSIVQFMTYRKKENGEELFLGPIDVVLESNQLVSKNFDLVAPDSGEYTILIRIAGWANEGNGIAVAVDNVSLKAN